jgi:hypothetical protein
MGCNEAVLIENTPKTLGVNKLQMSRYKGASTGCKPVPNFYA